jgi:hypothetical protein
MTDSSAVAAAPVHVSKGNWPWRLALVAILTALADWLLFRQHVGIAFPIFILALAAAALLVNRTGAGLRARIVYAGVLVAAILPSLESVNIMSVLIAAFGIGCFALGATGALKGGLIERFLTVGWLLVSGPLQLVRDLPLLQRWASERGAPASLGALNGWVVPLGLGAVFVALFASANPVIAHWLAQWGTGDLLRQLDLQRLMFWGFIVVAVWGLLGVASRFALPRFDEPVNDQPSDIDLSSILSDTAILRSLVLFNLLFAVQTVMDIHYLWRGAALPDGMTYATYAHRGAYPLIVTALLAAGFVLATMRPGSGAERSPLMRALVFLWVGQNVLLVVSSIMRLNLYVETYLLTYWRLAAFIWMGIVAAGLILIVADRHASLERLADRGQSLRAGADDLRLQLRQLPERGRKLQRCPVARLRECGAPDRSELHRGSRTTGHTRARPLYRRQPDMGSALLPRPPRQLRGRARGARAKLARLYVPRLAAHALSRGRETHAALTPP